MKWVQLSLELGVEHSDGVSEPNIEVVDVAEGAERENRQRQHDGLNELVQGAVDVVSENALHVPVGM